MALLQKISRPRVRILGTEYSSRIVGLHNRLRAHARRLLVYKEIGRLPRRAAARARGLFVAGARRDVIYLRRGAPESTIAHELIHALLCTEGFLPLRCRKDDLADHPEIGALAENVNDLLVHPVLFARMRRYGLAAEEGGPAAPGATTARHRERPPRRSPDSPAAAPPNARGAVRLLAHAVQEAERRHRAAADRTRGDAAIASASRTFEGIVREIMAIAPWDSERRALDARAKAGAILKRLEEVAGDLLGLRAALSERILLPPYVTPARLACPAAHLFEVRTGGGSGGLVTIVFRPDGTACTARVYADSARAEKAAAAVAREIGSMTAARFIDRHRLEYLLVERRGRCRPCTGGRTGI